MRNFLGGEIPGENFMVSPEDISASKRDMRTSDTALES